MRIAFDLDDTLIPVTSASFPVEAPSGLLWRWLAGEHFRIGAGALLRALRRHGCDIWVYTTSFRDPFYVRSLFWSYGVWASGIINQDVHDRWARRQRPPFYGSKFPPAWGIDLLIDNSEGVVIEGRQYHFRVLHVRPDDATWTQKVVTEINHVLARPIVLQ
jgi:hypothetical protein